MPYIGKLSTQEAQQQVADQYLTGVGVTQIAKNFGVTYPAVREHLLRKGLLRPKADRQLHRFESCFTVTPGCWLWNGEIGISGYGRFTTEGKKLRAHRFAYTAYKGPIPQGMLVLHSCDNPRCVNPDHLRVGTNVDNTRDKRDRNRFNAPKGEASNLSKLSEQDVVQIRSDTRIAREVARDFGVTRSAIQSVRSKKTWAHVQ